MDQKKTIERFEKDVFPNWEELYDRWKSFESIAQDNMKHRLANGTGCLITVAAQHPLAGGRKPGPEFQARLDLGYQLYREKVDAGIPTLVYVPGSRHQINGVADVVSLSEAGCRYLLDKGIDPTDLHGEDVINKYKPGEGVYNSQDEAYTAARFFIDRDCAELHVVCSVNQVPRNVLTYLQLGLQPMYHTISLPDPSQMFHSAVWEMFWGVPLLLADGHAYQGNSELAEEMRRNRNPDYGK